MFFCSDIVNVKEVTQCKLCYLFVLWVCKKQGPIFFRNLAFINVFLCICQFIDFKYFFHFVRICQPKMGRPQLSSLIQFVLLDLHICDHYFRKTLLSNHLHTFVFFIHIAIMPFLLIYKLILQIISILYCRKLILDCYLHKACLVVLFMRYLNSKIYR